MISVNAALAVILPCVAGVVWLVRLEGRVNGHDHELSTHEKGMVGIKADVQYIRERIDNALDGRKDRS